MTTEKKDPKELWVQWTRDAAGKYVPPESIDSMEELVDDMVAFTTDYASAMLDEYEEIFNASDRSPRSKPRKRKPAED